LAAHLEGTTSGTAIGAVMTAIAMMIGTGTAAGTAIATTIGTAAGTVIATRPVLLGMCLASVPSTDRHMCKCKDTWWSRDALGGFHAIVSKRPTRAFFKSM
jgi:hypothetical protein